MRGINIYTGEEDLKDQGHTVQVTRTRPDGVKEQGWVIGRPIGFIGFWHRVKCAWLVFREKADIVIWKYQ